MRISVWSSDVCSSDLLMSMGVHRVWKRFAIDLAGVRAGERVLDVAGGTGDLSREFAKAAGPKGQVILSDINAAMLGEGRKRLVDHGLLNVPLVQANAEQLPFEEGSFDCITIRSEEHTSELQSLMRISYAVFCLKKKKK